jgi:hypothetical protein
VQASAGYDRAGAAPCGDGGTGIVKAVFAATVIALLALPAYAQSPNSRTPGPPPPPPKSQQEIQAERAAEQAYKKSLSDIPDQPAADPWGAARASEAPATAAKTAKAKKPPAKTSSSAN